ncbi:MAG: hypothetical protein MJ196_05035 [Treponemataceae bacterium]|nr:hypothetical protein [Treponemataceae bacterium]
MKKVLFYICLFLSVFIFFVMPVSLVNKISFKGMFISYYISVGMGWLYIGLLLGSVYIPFKYKFKIPWKVLHLIIVVLFTAVCFFVMNGMTP